MDMRFVLLAAIFVASTVPAFAVYVHPVPEIDALAGFSALAVIGSIAALIWERRRHRPR
jgi:hypothetical protein